MTVTGAGSITAANVQAVNNMTKQLDQLSVELGSGQKATTYSGLASQAGLTVQLNAQLAAITGYSNTATTVGTTLSVAQSVLGQIGDIGNAVMQSVNQQGAFTLDGNGQTTTQQSAGNQLDQILSLLDTQAGSNYLFSGSAVSKPSVADTDEILNGSGGQAGLIQVIAERNQADVGAGGLGRLLIPAASGSNVSIGEDVAGSPFGLKLAGVTSSLTGAVVSGPSGSPPSISIGLGSNPNDGDKLQLSFNLPDGSSQTITLQATSASPPGANQFTIGASQAATATSLQAALTSAVQNLAQTTLPAASTIAAANEFFSTDPPQRVNGSPATATSLVNGTAANTVFWYTGESGSTPARQTATAQVGPSMSIAYGMRANEQGISSLVANIAALAATSYSASDPNAQASYQALSQRVTAGLDGKSGQQSVADIEADLASAQTTVSNATGLNTQTQSTLNEMLQGIEGVNQTQIGEQILTLQNSLSAALSVTARMSQFSLVNFLAPSAG